MASARTLRAPGIETREIDRSAYGLQDNSLPNASTCLVTGFADKGDSYNVKWINTIETLKATYGLPKTKFESIFHNACIEILNRGGVCLASKLPYENVESKNYSFCDYKVLSNSKPLDSSSSLSAALSVDSTLTSYLELTDCQTRNGKMSLEAFDELKVNASSAGIKGGGIRVVDISRSRYQEASFNCVSSTCDGNVIETNECLGIFPVVVSPLNALYWQHLKDLQNTTSADFKAFNTLKKLDVVGYQFDGQAKRIDVDLRKLPANSLVKPSLDDSDYEMLSSTPNYYPEVETLSKIAAQHFPSLNFKDPETLEAKYLKQVGIVVFRAYADSSNSNKVNYQVLESFVGSLKRGDKNRDGSSAFLDDIVNKSSRYINTFTNINSSLLDRVKTVFIKDQTSRMLGFFELECEKKIDVKTSILDPLTILLDKIQDKNQYALDVIVDAGVSNIAQYFETYQKWQLGNPSKSIEEFAWRLGYGNEIKDQILKWQQVIKKFDDFCKFTRKDCMFIADGLRPFCLEGDEKIVRETKLRSSVTKDILPRLRYISGLNSSYSAGYCNWFRAQDYYSGDLFWCPPSIKAASIYIYCDTYFHTWDAPAGLTRGIVPNVVDVSFNPTQEEAGKLYDQSWNYAVSYPVDGIIMEGQKTFQSEKTALDRCNVRRLLLGLEKKVARVAKYFLYEGHTEYLRQKFVDTIKPIFEDAVNGSGIAEYAIKCDEVLNTPQVIENNELRCRIGIRPIKTIEWIVLDFICTNQTASVSEEVLKE